MYSERTMRKNLCAPETSLFHLLSPTMLWAGVLVLVCAQAIAQENTLSVTSEETIPGSRVSIFLVAELDQPIRGFQVGIEYSRLAMKLDDMSFVGTEFEGRRLDLFEPEFSTAGFATIRVSLDERPPFATAIEAGSEVRLLRLDFEMNQGLNPGDSFDIKLKSRLVFPDVEAALFTASGSTSVTLNSGVVSISTENVLRVETVSSVRAGEVSTLEFRAFNLKPLQGFTIGMTFDPERVRFLSVHLDGTITEAVGAEFLDPVIDNENGVLIIGVLLDIMPPFEAQHIPANGLAFTIAKVDFVVNPPVDPVNPPSPEIELTLTDGLGNPPKKNIFVIDNESVFPTLNDGSIVVKKDLIFVRGDAAMDGRINIADAVRVLNYAVLQIQGVPCQKAADANDDSRIDLADVLFILFFLFERADLDMAPPFPNPGVDPTPDTLTCESSGMF